MSHQRMTMKRTMLASSAAAALALTGCSMGSDSAKSATSSATSAASSAASSASGSSSAAPSTESSTSPAAESSSSSSASSSSPSASPSSSVALPADTQLARATVNKLSFAVPKSWTVIDGDRDDQDALKKKLEPLTKKAGTSPEKYLAQVTSTADVFAVDATAPQKFNDNINVVKMARPTLPGKTRLAQELNMLNSSKGGTSVKVTTGEYSRITTPAGPGEQMKYTLTAKGATVHGVSMMIPNGAGTYSILTVSASSDAKADQYAKDVAATAQKM